MRKLIRTTKLGTEWKWSRRPCQAYLLENGKEVVRVKALWDGTFTMQNGPHGLQNILKAKDWIEAKKETEEIMYG